MRRKISLKKTLRTFLLIILMLFSMLSTSIQTYAAGGSSVVTSGGIGDSNTNYGGLQRKVTQGNTGTVSFDAQNSTATHTTNSITMSLTTGSGSNRALIVTIGTRGAFSVGLVQSVTYAGQNLQFIGRQSAVVDVATEMWGMVAPTTGANDVVVTLTNAGDSVDGIIVGASTYTGVDQINPFGPLEKNSSLSSSNSISTTALTNSGDMVVDVVTGPVTCPTNTFTKGGSQTLNNDACDATGSVRMASSRQAGATSGSVTMSWTRSNNDQLQQVAVDLHAAPATGSFYTFYTTSGNNVVYKKSSDGGVTWGSEVKMDDNTSTNINPSVYAMGGYIYAAWFDTTANTIRLNRINVKNSDTKSTQCASSSLGSISTTYTLSLAVASNSTVVVAYSDTAAGSDYGVLDVSYDGSTCTFTNVTTGARSGASGTKFYLPSQKVPTTVSPSYQSWDVTSSALRNRTSFAKQNSAQSTTTFTDSDTTNQKILFTQYISDPIAAQSFSAGGTAEFEMAGKETNAANNLFLAYSVSVVSNDGSTSRGTIISLGTGGTELTTTDTARSFTNTTSAVSAQDGDRIVIEIGYGGTPTAATHTGDLCPGDAGTLDIASGNTSNTTCSGGTGQDNPWVTLPSTVTLVGSGLSAGDRPVLVNRGDTIDMVFQDGNLSHSSYDVDTGTWQNVNTTIASVTDSSYSATTDGTNVYVLSVPSSTATSLYKYNGSTWSTLSTPWTGQTNLTGASITYDASIGRLYAFAIHDSTSALYTKYGYDGNAGTFWSVEKPMDFTAGTITNASSSMYGNTSDADLGVVVRQGSNLEFQPIRTLNPGDATNANEVSTQNLIGTSSDTHSNATLFGRMADIGINTNTGADNTLFGRVGSNTNTQQCSASFTTSGSWDVSLASYASKNVSVTSQDTTPRQAFFSSDGTKMYIMGGANNAVYQYSLSTAWDVSSGSYASKSFTPGEGETFSTSIFFKSDGSKMYIIGTGNDTVYQYSLSTAWDVSTASYDSKSYNETQDTSPRGLFFKDDGSAMYVLGWTNERVYQYTLGTAWDVSTASYATKNFSVNAEDGSAFNMFFKSDGSAAFVVGTNNDTVYQYTLGTPWDASTGSYASKSFSFSSQDSSVNGIAFSSDGSNMYGVGNTNDRVYQYTMGASTMTGLSCSNETLFGILRNKAGRPFLSQFGGDGSETYPGGTGSILVTNGIHQYSGAVSVGDGSTATRVIPNSAPGALFLFIKGALTVTNNASVSVVGYGGSGGCGGSGSTTNACGGKGGGANGVNGANGAAASSGTVGAGGASSANSVAGSGGGGGSGGASTGTNLAGGGGGGSGGNGGNGGSAAGAGSVGIATSTFQIGKIFIGRSSKSPVSDKMFLSYGAGGGGGAGGNRGSGGGAGGGGGGGGVLWIRTHTITNSGTISANGGAGGAAGVRNVGGASAGTNGFGGNGGLGDNGSAGGAATSSNGGGGGGGAGSGVLYIEADSVTVNSSGTISAAGANGGNGGNGTGTGVGGAGGKGANGFMFIEIVP